MMTNAKPGFFFVIEIAIFVNVPAFKTDQTLKFSILYWYYTLLGLSKMPLSWEVCEHDSYKPVSVFGLQGVDNKGHFSV